MRLRAFLQRQREFEHSMAICRLHVLRVDIFSQREVALEPPVRDVAHGCLGLLFGRALTAYAERPADDVDVDLVRRNARHRDRHHPRVTSRFTSATGANESNESTVWRGTASPNTRPTIESSSRCRPASSVHGVQRVTPNIATSPFLR